LFRKVLPVFCAQNVTLLSIIPNYFQVTTAIFTEMSLFVINEGRKTMQVAGIIAEYNPLHSGHLYQIDQTRERLGADAAILCVMSGNFVQRGDFAVLRKHARAEAAVRSGADLVLELPLPWAISSAERFAAGGVETLAATGVVTHLSFGSESGDGASLLRLAQTLRTPAFSDRLREALKSGVSFAAARQRAAEQLLSPEDAAYLRTPNDILGVEYCKSLLRLNSAITPLAIPRSGAAHDSAAEDAAPSAMTIRRKLLAGDTDNACGMMAPAMAALCRSEMAAGRGPVFGTRCERAVMARLRSMTLEDFAALDTGGEGLGNRFYAAVRTASTLGELLDAVKTKRYAYARLRRMALWAYLGLTPADVPETPPYLRVLAANAVGRTLLGSMRKNAGLPVLTKPADVRLLSARARALFALEVRATDLYTLAYPELSAAVGGSEWKEGPFIL
jgi:predicted nucleotidyltransferase